jgi:hypothetical protein
VADVVGLIKILMLVGFFHGDRIIGRQFEATTYARCEAVKSYAAEFNDQTNMFWKEDDKPRVVVACLDHPKDREA